MKILIVEDDKAMAELLKTGLAADSHNVDVATDGADGSFLARTYAYDAIILDYSLPKKDGLTVCREIRATGRKTPIIFLSTIDDTQVKVDALESGADDYMTKPFSLKELYARLKVVVKRPSEIKKPVLRIDDLTLDTNNNTVTRGEGRIRLTRKEFSLLEYFMNNVGVVLSRALLLEHVWTADSDPFSNTVEAHIRNVRKKISVDNETNLIVNIPGRGYLIDSAQNLNQR